jgi:hypothetical protein
MASPGRDSYPLITSKLDVSSSVAKENREAWQTVLENHSEALTVASSQGTSEAVSRHLARGQLTGMNPLELPNRNHLD